MKIDLFSRYSTAFVSVLLLSGCFADLSYLEQGQALGTAAATGGLSGGLLSSAAGAGGTGAAGASAANGAGMGGGAAGSSSTAHAEGAGAGAGATIGTGGGSAGATASCVSTGAEICNALDDDCNGVVDEGCPALSTLYVKDLGPLGDSPHGSVFADDCAAGEVLTGVAVAMNTWLSQIAGVCQPLSVISNPAEASGFGIQLGAAHSLVAHPAAASTPPVPLTCPANEAVVGLRLAQQYSDSSNSLAVIPRVWLSCAKLVLLKNGSQLSVDWAGAEEIGPTSGSIANGTAWFATGTVAQGLVASGVLGMASDWVDRAGFRTSSIAVVIR
jgi:hypothetical protein